MKCKVICGDALTYEFDKDIVVNHIITDPPYNISQKNNFKTMGKKSIDFGDWDWNFDLISWIEKYAKILDKNGSFIVFCDWKNISIIIEGLEKNGIVIKDLLRWVKINPIPRNRDRRYVSDTEYALWGVKKGAKWIFNRKNAPYLKPEIKTSLVCGKEKNEHPTQKSLELMKQIIKTHTNEGDLILDPFMGSGTTGVGALELERKFIGIEKEKEYFDIAKHRLTQFKDKDEKKGGDK